MSASPLPGSAREDFNLSGEPETPALELEPLQADTGASEPLQSELFLPCRQPGTTGNLPRKLNLTAWLRHVWPYSWTMAGSCISNTPEPCWNHWKHNRSMCIISAGKATAAVAGYSCWKAGCIIWKSPWPGSTKDEILPCCCIPRSPIKIKL